MSPSILVMCCLFVLEDSGIGNNAGGCGCHLQQAREVYVPELPRRLRFCLRQQHQEGTRACTLPIELISDPSIHPPIHLCPATPLELAPTPILDAVPWPAAIPSPTRPCPTPTRWRAAASAATATAPGDDGTAFAPYTSRTSAAQLSTAQRSSTTSTRCFISFRATAGRRLAALNGCYPFLFALPFGSAPGCPPPMAPSRQQIRLPSACHQLMP